VYTQKKQMISSLAVDLYWGKDTYHLTSNLQVTHYPDTFYGIGNDTPVEAKEAYTSKRPAGRLAFTWRFHPALYAGIQVEIIHATLSRIEEGGLLDQGDIPGAEKGLTSGLGFLFSLDSRDNIFAPSSGRFYQTSISVFDGRLGSDYAFFRYHVDLREYIPLFAGHVLGVQAVFQANTGEPPFYSMPLFGGASLMRGYYAGRYRDRNLLAFQMEYRLPVWRRFGLVGFAGIGDVSRRLSDFRLETFKLSAGLGVRFMIDPGERINIRMDYGFGQESSGFYVGILEAF
jgi:outer membrane protein assembly factor BamA